MLRSRAICSGSMDTAIWPGPGPDSDVTNWEASDSSQVAQILWVGGWECGWALPDYGNECVVQQRTSKQ